MYVASYRKNGKIIVSYKATSIEEKPKYPPHNTQLLYVDDSTFSGRITDYIVQNGKLVYSPIPIAVELLSLQTNKIEQLSKSCKEDILNGFSSSALGLSHDYKFDEEDQRNFSQQANALIFDSTIATIDWNTKDAGLLKHTREQFIQLLNDAQISKDEKVSHFRAMKKQILDAKTSDEVQTFQW